MKKYFFLFCSVLMVCHPIFGSAKTGLFLGSDGTQTDLDSVLAEIEPGTVILASEYHDRIAHHENQVRLLEQLAVLYPDVSINVGMEFLYYPDQKNVDNFLNGTLDEETFKTQIQWTGNFSFYRKQILFPATHNGRTLALNAPKILTQKVAVQGLKSLTDLEKILLPPGFELGNESYFNRFSEIMTSQHPMPEETLQNYFEAQSIWDDTMAWTAISYMDANPKSILVIIIGDFHVAYGGGLPDRLQARGLNNILTISQIDVSGFSASEWNETVLPHPCWGRRADFIWATENQPTVFTSALINSMLIFMSFSFSA